MTPEPKSLHLSFDEAEAVAADLARVWPGITGLAETPKTEQIADLVQRTLRKTRDLIDARDADATSERMHIPENELPY